MKSLTVISLGWGVQSWTLAAMSALGDLPKVDFAIHSDTTWERQMTYRFAQQWTPWLEERGVKVVTTNDARQAAKVSSNNTNSLFIPVFTREIVHERGNGGVGLPLYTDTKSVNGGQLRRQCTNRWKIVPMRRYISQILKEREIAKTPGVVEQWLGITKDEFHRAKDSDVKYIEHKYPLLDLGMNRGDCLNWLKAHNLPSPGKSSCTFCPYHSETMWAELKRENGPDWADAVKVDEVIRDKRPPYDLFVHSSRMPLIEAVKIAEDFGYEQLDLFDDQDSQCDSGYCFL